MYKAVDSKYFPGYEVLENNKPFRNYIVRNISEHFLVQVDESLSNTDPRVRTCSIAITHSLDEALTKAHEIMLGQVGFLKGFKDRTSKAKPRKKQ